MTAAWTRHCRGTDWDFDAWDLFHILRTIRQDIWHKSYGNL